MQIDRCRQSSADLKWIKGIENNAPVQYFIVQYNTTFNQDQWVSAKTVDYTQNTANIELSPWANYTFRVLAWNKIGASPPSFHTPRVCRTDPAQPSKNPQNVRSIGSKKGYLIIEWTVSYLSFQPKENFLTLYHTILAYNDPEKENVRKHCGKRRKCWEPVFSPFPTMFSNISKSNFIFWFTFILSFANDFNLDQTSILLSGKESNITCSEKSYFVFSEEEAISCFMFISPQMKLGGVYWSQPVCLSVCGSWNFVWGITSKLFKVVTSNFIHR